jgi:hypothetical protein
MFSPISLVDIQKVDKMEEKRQRNSYLSFRVA